jgi:hypothetical protein
MDYSFIKLTDLPDEILMIIFKKLYNFEVLYSLIDINDRLNKIALDSIFTSDLTLIQYVHYLIQYLIVYAHKFYLIFIIKSSGLILN